MGPVLFVCYINDLPENVESELIFFVDDTKTYTPIQSPTSQTELQESLDQLIEWTDKWLLRFNNQKCHALHLGRNNPNYEYMLEGWRNF